MSSVDFWKKVAERDYDLFVLGDKAPREIELFLEEEDKKLEAFVSKYVKRSHTVFVEIGSGTGRYLKFFGKKIITDKLHANNLRYIVGIDFCGTMIRKSIKNLNAMVGELAAGTERSVESIKREFISRIVLIQANAARPILRVRSAKIIVGLMFGTLGNIKDRESVLRNLSKIFENGGGIIMTVFNRDFMDIGFEVYRSLSHLGFKGIKRLTFENSDFSSPSGFYSHWFTYDELAELLKRHFGREPTIVPFRKRGLLASTRPRVRRYRGTSSKSRKEGEGDIVLICPNCERELHAFRPPLRAKELLCSSCKSQYKVEDFGGFSFPILVGKEHGK